MSSNGTFPFPSPIGGVPFPHDFAPALIFTILYALLIPVAVWRMAVKSSRTLVILGTVIISLERIADFAIRAAEAEKPNIRTTSFFVGWLQSAYGMGYLSMAMDLNNLARLFVATALISGPPAAPSSFPPPKNPFPGDMEEEEQPFAMAGGVRGDGGSSYSKLPLAEREPFGDEARLRGVFKRVKMLTLVFRLAALFTAVASGGSYYNGTKSPSTAAVVQSTRYASAFIVLISQVFAVLLVLWALRTRAQRMPHKPALYLLAMIGVNMTPTIYRLIAMRSHTYSLTAMGPGSLNGPTAKALFYALHIAPEWIAAAMLLGVNVKDMYGLTTLGR